MEYIPAKTIVTKTKSTAWFGTDYNMNLYKGCCHGCIYCDSRSDCYGIGDFDRVRAKENALEIVRNELRRKVKTGVIGTGAMSDPYNPFEKELCLTRHSLELISAFGFGVAIATKSPLVTRDLDVLSEIRSHSPVLVKVTVTTPHDELSKKLEPHAAPSSYRLQAVKKLAGKGIFTGILLMPVLPFIEDDPADIEQLVDLAAESGARFIYPAFGVTLRENQRQWFFQELDRLFPGKKEAYIKKFGTNYECRCPNAKGLWKIFSARCQSHGILYDMRDIIKAYKTGYGDNQISFL